MAGERAAVAEMLGGQVPSNGVLVIHSGFRKLGAAGCTPDGVIEALIEAVPDGTLVMPAMSWRVCTPENPFFDELETPSNVGLLSELFRTRYASHRSLHPTHSVAALGPHAAMLTAEHHRDTSPCGPHNPYALMRGLPAHVLMLDCGFERCTAIHQPEEDHPDLYLLPLDESPLYELRDRHGGTHPMRLRRHRRLNRCFEKFEGLLADRGRLRQGVSAGAPSLLCSLSDLLDEVSGLMARDPNATLAPEGTRTRLSGPR